MFDSVLVSIDMVLTGHEIHEKAMQLKTGHEI